MNLRLKALLILPISPIWVVGAVIIEHWYDIARFYEEIFQAILGKHPLQLREKERADK